VVDGSATSSAAEVVAQLSPTVPFPVHLVATPPGLTRQRNAGLARVAGDVVVFLDDDARVDQGAFDVIARAYEDPGVVGATGRVVEPSSHRVGGQRSQVRRLLAVRQREGTFTTFGYPRRIVDGSRPADVEFMPGCFMSARTSTAREVGFDEGLPGYALAEDEDFSYRVSRLGRIRYLPEAVVHHDNSGFGHRDRRAFGRAVLVNRHYLFRKNFPQTVSARGGFVLLVFVLLAHRLLNFDWRGLQGLFDGVVALRRGETPASLTP
jgi:GT2 family glycosyltransferase